MMKSSNIMNTEAAANITAPLDTLVPISQFCRSSASRAFAKVANITRDHPCQD